MTRICKGDKVRMYVKDWNRYDYGEVTLTNGIMCLVLFDDSTYGYYPEHFLQLVKEEDNATKCSN